MNPQNRTEPPGCTKIGHPTTAFTITELLVVISLIAILMSTVLPASSMMRDMVACNTAINTAAVAVTTVQAYAMVAQGDLQDGGDPDKAGFTYSGTAVLFTPAGELRLVENDQNASDAALTPPDLEANNRNGYRDIAGRNYIKLPKDVGVVGIARGDGGAPDLFTPPFAIRFNKRGNLIAGAKVDYDGNNYDGDYEATSRPDDYDPDSSWDPTVTSVGMADSRYFLPFEQIETVVGVVVYSKSDLREAEPDLTHVGNLTTRNALNANARDWILANGETLLFSRYNGTMIRKSKS